VRLDKYMYFSFLIEIQTGNVVSIADDDVYKALAGS
jgi:hypothetical protein